MLGFVVRKSAITLIPLPATSTPAASKFKSSVLPARPAAINGISLVTRRPSAATISKRPSAVSSTAAVSKFQWNVMPLLSICAIKSCVKSWSNSRRITSCFATTCTLAPAAIPANSMAIKPAPMKATSSGILGKFKKSSLSCNNSSPGTDKRAGRAPVAIIHLSAVNVSVPVETVCSSTK